ncbi:transposase [Romboutsia sp.]|uniref:transposase n=1 Tax=Romboutsia sp. TaxID=1965302 RepID=UPI003F41222B
MYFILIFWFFPKLVDIIDSRETKDVTAWLQKFPNISVVSRDGSIAYRKAILDSHKSAIQVTDRFHLLQNLTKYCKDFLLKYIYSNRVSTFLHIVYLLYL